MPWSIDRPHRSLDEPPTSVVVGGRDGIAPPAAMERRVAALRSAGTEVEYHVHPGLGHGFGPGTGTEAEGWIAEAVAFWARQAERRAGRPASPGGSAPTYYP